MTMTFRDYTNHPILQKYIDVLSRLDDERVMCVCYEKDKSEFSITECCDEWFTYYLTKEDCIELSELFREIAEEIDNLRY